MPLAAHAVGAMIGVRDVETFDRTVQLEDERATAGVAGRLAAVLGIGDVIALSGPLGSGKTAFARALIRSLCGAGEVVPSPTFTLAQIYESPGFPIWHFDLYRLDRAEDAVELGLDEALATGVSMIEWPERLDDLLPARALRLAFDFADDPGARTVRFFGQGAWIDRLPHVADD